MKHTPLIVGSYSRMVEICELCKDRETCKLEVGECITADGPKEAYTPEMLKLVKRFRTPWWFKLWLEIRYPKQGWLWWFIRYRVLLVFVGKGKN